MELTVHALVVGSPFQQWLAIGVRDVLFLMPWVLLVWLLTPKGGEAKVLRVSWRAVLLAGTSVAALTFFPLVVYYTIARS
jgi:hypothetical protein